MIYESLELQIEDIFEGAWGHHPLANDSASDWKWVFGDKIMEEISNRIKLNLEAKEHTELGALYESIGMWEFFRDRLETQYSVFKDDDIKEMNQLCIKAAQVLLESPYHNSYKSPDKIHSYLNKFIKINS